jgi:hypothetical protein
MESAIRKRTRYDPVSIGSFTATSLPLFLASQHVHDEATPTLADELHAESCIKRMR